ncbi:MAG: DUF4058 family protein [Chloroflexi bacterium]|nr:DUF4058 family protein [Chloroflexota bacterium]
MASPFPGMDPYLEGSDYWPGFHHALAEEIRGRLNARIGPKYYAEVNVLTVFEDSCGDNSPKWALSRQHELATCGL